MNTESQMSDERATRLWRHWLSSMASDAETALGAAIAYREMDAESREHFLSSLAVDAPEVGVPKVALYAPLLAVERDPERRERLLEGLGDDIELALPRVPCWGLSARLGREGRAHVLVIPLYLDFVQILACHVQGGEFSWVRHDPIAHASSAPRGGAELFGTTFEPMPVKAILDELAVAVLSHRRKGKELPEALGVLADLLGPDAG